MADLMKGTATYDSLAKKYNNFMVPAIKIKIQGKDVISDLKLMVDNVSIVLSLSSSSSCNFSVVNAYDLEDSCFLSKVVSKLKLGTVFDVEIGYGSSTTMVFKGYISEVSMVYSDSPTLEVTGMDVRKLMMDGKKRMLNHNVKNYSEAFTQVMSKYQKLCTNMETDKTNDNLGERGVHQTVSDYKFVRDVLCRKAGRMFLVNAGKAYFIKPGKYSSPITTLKWGKNLMSFTRRVGYVMSNILVIGYNEEDNTSIVGKEKAKATDAQSAVVTDPNPTIIQDPDATDASKAGARAKALSAEKEKEGQSASGACIGLPELVPGRYVKIDKLGSGIKANFFITKVSHEFGSDGFTTNFEIGGWS